MFEIIDMCSIIGCQPLITVNNEELASDMADFVEYVWGDASTPWGNTRINVDGHAPIYNVSWIEIGILRSLPPFRTTCQF